MVSDVDHGVRPRLSASASIFLWPLRMDDLLTLACDVGGALNEEQREEHVQDETYRAMCSDRQS